MTINDLITVPNRRDGRIGCDYYENTKLAECMYYNRLVDIAISSFNWEGLPVTIDTRFLELCLLRYGAVIVFKDEVLGWLSLPFNYGGDGLDEYGEPRARTAYGRNRYINSSLNETNSVIIYNNLLKQPGNIGLKFYANKLASIEDIYNTNLQAQRTPFVTTCDESQVETVRRSYDKVRNGERLIIGVKGQMTPLTVLHTEAPYLCGSLSDEIHRTWDDAMQYLGINSHEYEKREREVSAALDFKAGAINAARYSRFAARNNACKAMKELFGFKCSVAFYDEVPETIAAVTPEEANILNASNDDNNASTLG